jgi:chromosome partitioning protein
MAVIVVANPKGGVGKSTLSTNLSGHFASKGEWVALADLDRQQSSHSWLDIRPAGLPAIEAWKINLDEPQKPPKGLEQVVIDTGSILRSGSRIA